MNDASTYPIGTPGKPWGENEVAQWRSRQQPTRSHADDVVAAIETLRASFDVTEYGAVEEGGTCYPLIFVRSREWVETRPTLLVTGGVHGYETSGVEGALQFLREHGHDYDGHANLLAVPCVSPWAYERLQRWNAQAIDPNRNFTENSPAAESAALVALLAPLRDTVLVHIDLHETTDSDESEFRPAVAARDGKVYEPGEVPDGFYLVDDTARPQPAFQQSIIEAVTKVTHIAPADANNEIIGSPVIAHGVIEYDLKALGLCAGITNAPYVTTTEVYPDSPRANPQQCNDAQVAAVRAAFDFALAHPPV